MPEAGDVVVMLYRNWRGVTAVRRITLGPRSLRFGSTEWHPDPEWLLDAIDADRGVERTFAVSGIKAWGRAAVNEALAGMLARPGETYQARVQPWLDACFGRAIATDKVECNHRFLEEALETVQAAGCTVSEAHHLVDYVYGRPAGELQQEVGGVMNTLAALCLAHGLDMHEAGETELARVWTKVEQIRAKQAGKPKHGPLPGPSEPGGTDA